MFYLNKNTSLNIKKKWNKKAAEVVTVALIFIRFNSLTNDLNYLVNNQKERVINCNNRPINSCLNLAPETVKYFIANIYKL